jgi:hypothetical protein
MKIERDEAISKDPALAAAVDEASKLLEQELGPSAATVRARWTLSEDSSGRPLVDLSVSDWTGSVGYRFAAPELSNKNHMQLRLHRLWGDLLQVRSHYQIDSKIWSLQEQAEA